MGRFDLVPQALAELGVQPGVPQGRAAAGQADVVRHRADGHGGVRAARQSGVDAGVPGALCAAGAVSRPWAVRSRRASGLPSPRRSTSKPPLAGFMPVQLGHDDWGRPWADARAHERIRRLHRAGRHRRFRRTAAGPNTYPKGFVTRLYRW